MGIKNVAARSGDRYLTRREVEELNDSLALQPLIPKVCKRFNGKSFISKNGETTLESSDRVISREQKKIFHLSLKIGRDSAIVVLETTPFLPSDGIKGSKVGMRSHKVNIGILTIAGFQRSTVTNLPILAKGLGLTFLQLIECCEKFAEDNKHRLNIQTEPREGDLSSTIVRVIPASQLQNCYPKYQHK